ncbi:hypothetical protein P5673_032697 [Acropora cervicornis]|uniref:DDE Tnp4 domain-containing protein n=1 Tax=Acropora cervicornis TaxID=6130 RepID=A0AAD9URU6_ACRCE|nr:hypothetical protein P5673_032697 [Acropora cervicornis]
MDRASFLELVEKVRPLLEPDHTKAKLKETISEDFEFSLDMDDLSVADAAWGGRTSDVHVTRESGFYDILEQHDEVMADRGFTIAEDLLLQDAKLHIPPGKRGWEQFSKSEVKKTKEIANLRILLSKPYED